MNKTLILMGLASLLSACVGVGPDPSPKSQNSIPKTQSSHLASSISAAQSSALSSAFSSSSFKSSSSKSSSSPVAVSSAPGRSSSSSAPVVYQAIIGSDAPAPSNGRRLTKREYLNTINDVLAVNADALRDLIPNDNEAPFFRNDRDVLLPSGVRTDAYEQAAIYIANNIPLNRLMLSIRCQQFQTDCIEHFLNDMGQLLYRRPLVQSDIVALSGLFDVAQKAGDDFIQGTRLALQAMLQMPEFLYRLERPAAMGSASILSPYVIASRTAFLLWQSSPDKALLQKVQNGGFEKNALESTLDEMMRDPRFKRMVTAFADEWLKLYLLDNKQVDPIKYPGITTTTLASMKQETFDYFERIALDSRIPFMSIYTDQQTNIDNQLARIYGHATAGLIDWRQQPERIGFMTQASVLTAHAKADDDTIVRRGLFVLDRLQCKTVPTLPASVQQIITDSFKEINHQLSQRDRLAIHNDATTNGGSCNACHMTFDGLGHAFEPYGAYGQFREVDKNNNPILHDGVARIDDRDIPFNDVTDFAHLMKESNWAKRCVVIQNVRFAFGRNINTADQNMIDSLVNNFDYSRQNFTRLIKEIVLSEPFLKRVE